MKRFGIFLTLVAMLIACLAVFPAWAEDTPVLSTDKTVYEVGDPIMVTAHGSGSDWVGIYPADKCEVGVDSTIRYYYCAKDGIPSGTPVDMRNALYVDNGRPALINIPVGKYKIVMCANDGYDVLGEVDIEVVPRKPVNIPDEVPDKPAEVTYTSAKAGKGRADGTVTIKAGAKAPYSYTLWWANADGPIEGYTEMDTLLATGETTTLTVTPNTLIPQGADRILVYAANGDKQSEAYTLMLPDGAGNYALGEIKQEFQVMSDVHVKDQANHIHNKHWDMALQDIVKISPNSMGIFLNGDTVDTGSTAEYAQFHSIIERNKGVPTIYAGIGNHEFYQALTIEAIHGRFLKETGNDSETIYFDRRLGGAHFIFLGSEAATQGGAYATLSQTQLDWLKGLLEEDAKTGVPVFLFLHQGIINTSAGTMGYQGWHGIHQGQELLAIIEKHPNVVMFSGHSHWILESDLSFNYGGGERPTYVNTASCGYLWDDGANLTNTKVKGSQGYYVYMYDDCIVFRGRDFEKQAWIGSAQFVLPLAGYGEGDDVTETTEVQTEPVVDPEETTAAVADTDAITPAPGTDATTGAVTDPSVETDAESGCSSVVSSSLVILLLSALGAVYAVRRRGER